MGSVARKKEFRKKDFRKKVEGKGRIDYGMLRTVTMYCFSDLISQYFFLGSFILIQLKKLQEQN